MIDSVIFYNNSSGTTYSFLGKQPIINGSDFASDILGPLFCSFSYIKHAEVIENNFRIKSKGYEVIGTCQDQLFFGLKNDNLGLIGIIKPEQSNIFLDTTVKVYSLLRDEAGILGVDYNDLINDFIESFADKTINKNYFEKVNIFLLRRDFNNYSKTLLSSIKDLYKSKDLMVYSIVKEFLAEQKEYVETSLKNKLKIQKLIKEYNSVSKDKWSMSSSILTDFGKTYKILEIIKPFLFKEHGNNLLRKADVELFSKNCELLEKINAKFSINEDLASDLPDAINEIFEDNEIIR